MAVSNLASGLGAAVDHGKGMHASRRLHGRRGLHTARPVSALTNLLHELRPVAVAKPLVAQVEDERQRLLELVDCVLERVERLPAFRLPLELVDALGEGGGKAFHHRNVDRDELAVLPLVPVVRPLAAHLPDLLEQLEVALRLRRLLVRRQVDVEDVEAGPDLRLLGADRRNMRTKLVNELGRSLRWHLVGEGPAPLKVGACRLDLHLEVLKGLQEVIPKVRLGLLEAAISVDERVLEVGPFRCQCCELGKLVVLHSHLELLEQLVSAHG